jgi:SET domain-containing protein
MSELDKLVYVADAAVGRGVFAANAIEADDVIGEILGEVIDDPDYSSHYCIDLGDSLSLEPAPPFRFLNHSCEPNCELFQWVADEEEQEYEEGEEDWSRRMWLAALRPIEPGEELTIDYAWPADVAMRCHCNTPSCRGWIVDPAELPTLQSTPLPVVAQASS